MRLADKGLVDRGAVLNFRFDGRNYKGFQGDTLASALLANDVRLIARSFKYHRPRGVLSAGSEEPNALVTLGNGAARTPNLRATTVELFDGLNGFSQNRWPSLRADVMAVNDLLSPFLSAGFYYKTFMWPRAFWEKLYEPVIRRAAGLGALSGAHDTGRYDKAFGFCDILIIGAGPAGLMAALSAGRAGADVLLVDEQPQVGGRLLGEDEQIGGQPGHLWAAAVLAELDAMANVRVMLRTTVTGAYDQGTYGALQNGQSRAQDNGDAPLETFWRIAAKRALLCAGALERPIAFKNNDRPGIMLASAVRSYLHRWGVVAGRRVAVFGNNDDAHRTVRDLRAAGVNVVAQI
ncbi:MAG: 2Fe-2S iron-sulfur cluster-binding protein, partial [Paracoccaceae bacterium]